MTDVLLLNADGQYLRKIHWQDAVRLLWRGNHPGERAEAVALTDIALGNGQFRPKAVRLQKQVRRFYGPKIHWTPDNLKVRDGYVCQYCGETFSPNRLTVEHVVPESKGGQSSWENTVAACKPCNNRKANRTPSEARMPLIKNGRQLKAPTIQEFFRKKVRLLGIDDVLNEIGGWY
jgi:hypothetical protein